jgi:DNA replication protein DnaC
MENTNKELSDYTVSELKRMCKDNDIECKPGLKKGGIIKLLEELDEIIFKPKGKGKVKKITKSKPSIFAHLSYLKRDKDAYNMLSTSEDREEMLKNVEDKLNNYDWSIADKKDRKEMELFRDRLTKDTEESVGDDTMDFDDVETPKTQIRESDTFNDLFDNKPNIGQRLSHVNTTYKRFQTTTILGVRREMLNELKLLLKNYDWKEYHGLKIAIEFSIVNSNKNGYLENTEVKNAPQILSQKYVPVVSGGKSIDDLVKKNAPQILEKSLALAPSPKKPRTPSQRYVPGVYKSLDMGSSIKFAKKSDATPGAPAKQKITITLDEFRKEIKKPLFIKSFTNSARELMKAKEIVYQKRLAETQREYNALKTKVFRLRSSGTSDSTIKEMYPGYDTMGAYIIDIENVVELVKKRGETISELEIAEGLEEALEDPDDGIAALMGRIEIKNQLASQLYSFSKGYKTFFGNFNNMMITGPPGSGKTKMAKTIAFAFSKVGILARGIVKIVTRTELVGQYIGHTAPRTRGALLETLEGILFIDEAYQLTPCPEDRAGSRDFGSEAITEMVNFLDKYIGLNIVIVAGYEGVMNRCFMTANEGLPRRFPYRYVLSSYTVSELTDILVSNLKRKVRDGVVIDGETGDFLYSLTNKLFTEIPDVFKNQAGDMLNLSSNLNNAINSSYHIDWSNGDLSVNKQILISGFDDFLESKGYSIKDD